jgi:hypothetical protein
MFAYIASKLKTCTTTTISEDYDDELPVSQSYKVTSTQPTIAEDNSERPRPVTFKAPESALPEGSLGELVCIS